MNLMETQIGEVGMRLKSRLLCESDWCEAEKSPAL